MTISVSSGTRIRTASSGREQKSKLHISQLQMFAKHFFSYFPFSMAVSGRRGLVIFLFCVLSSYTVYARIRKGKYSFLQNFCTGKEIYNAIPWDCSGYVHCHGNTAFWIECPTNLYYSAEAKTCMWPTSLNRPCPPLKG